jgi:hypothetical protein
MERKWGRLICPLTVTARARAALRAQAGHRLLHRLTPPLRAPEPHAGAVISRLLAARRASSSQPLALGFLARLDSTNAVNAIAYATKYYPEWFWKGAEHLRKWRTTH